MILNGRIVDPLDGVFEGSIVIEGEKIAKVKSEFSNAPDALQLPETCYIFPGFIDPHVHLREPGWEHKEDFYTGSLAAVHGGVTAVADMPNLPSPVTNLQTLKKKMELAGKAKIDVFHMGGVGKDISKINEIADLIPAYKIYTAESTGELTIGSWEQIERAIEIITGLGKPISFHCESQDINDASKESLKEENYQCKHYE